MGHGPNLAQALTTMTKADIVENIHSTTGLPKKDSAEMMESVLASFRPETVTF